MQTGSVLLLLAVVRITLSQISELAQSGREFEDYKKNNNKIYTSAQEETLRLNNYLQNREMINKHNEDQSNSYTMAINQFGDLTHKEFKEKMLTLKVPPERLKLAQGPNVSYTMPTVDWVSKGKVTAVKNQGYCGSCWAFAAVGAIESAYWIKKKHNNTNLSEQQLVDCTRNAPYYNTGCSGGWMVPAYKYVKAVGLNLESDYVYRYADMACTASKGPYKISGYTDKYDCAGLAAAVALQPVSVAIDASNWAYYGGGIFSNCGSTYLNHAVLLVGAGSNFWKIKNSWGSNWGENGYIRLAAPASTCGICRTPSYPLV